jgi:hypothetical protein
MKEAIEIYYENKKKAYKEYGLELPTIPAMDDWESIDNPDSDMFVGVPDEDFEIQWVIKESRIDKESLKDFKFKDELLEYFTSYRFMSLEGEYEKIDYYFTALCGDVKLKIECMVADGQYYKGDNYIMLGGASTRGSDDYVILYNIVDESLMIYDIDKEKEEAINHSLTEIIKKMDTFI